MDKREGQRGRRFAAARLKEFTVSLLRAVGVPEEDGQITAHVLVEAELTGRHTHGLNRLPLYVERVERGLIRPVPELSWQVRGQPAVVLLDATAWDPWWRGGRWRRRWRALSDTAPRWWRCAVPTTVGR
jgi:hypothetical protein